MSKKQTKAIIKIVVWSLVFWMLIEILEWGINWNSGNFLWFSGGWFGYTYADADEYDIGTVECDVTDVTALEVNWTSGGVRLETYDGDKIVVSETSGSSLSEDDKMRYRLKNGVLTIQFAKSRRFFSFHSSPRKELLIQVPVDYEPNSIKMETASAKTEVYGIRTHELDIETASGKIDLENVTCYNLDIEGVSGKLSLQNIVTDTLDVETVSGKVDISGSFREGNVEGVSGKVDFDLDNVPDVLNYEGVSGSVTINIPEELCTGYRLHFEGVSGKVNSEFEASKRNNTYTYGDGSMEMNIEVVSGNVNIRKK